MGAQIFEFPSDATGLRNARLIVARSDSPAAEFRFARRHLLALGSDSDRALARRATRNRSETARALDQAHRNADRIPMPAIPAASPAV